jgi:hypothetical protein
VVGGRVGGYILMKRIILIAIFFSNQVFSIEGTEIDDLLLPPISKEEQVADFIKGSAYALHVVSEKLARLEKQIKDMPREIDLINEFLKLFVEIAVTYSRAQPIQKFAATFSNDRRKGKIRDTVWFEKQVDQCIELLSLYAKNSKSHQAVMGIQKQLKQRNKLGKRYLIGSFHKSLLSLWSVNHLEMTSEAVMKEVISAQVLIFTTQASLVQSTAIPADLKNDFVKLVGKVLPWLMNFNTAHKEHIFQQIIYYVEEMKKLFVLWDYIETVGFDD